MKEESYMLEKEQNVGQSRAKRTMEHTKSQFDSVSPAR